jgi:hypothetical protein
MAAPYSSAGHEVRLAPVREASLEMLQRGLDQGRRDHVHRDALRRELERGDGLQAVRLAEAANASITSGQAIELSSHHAEVPA